MHGSLAAAYAASSDYVDQKQYKTLCCLQPQCCYNTCNCSNSLCHILRMCAMLLQPITDGCKLWSACNYKVKFRLLAIMMIMYQGFGQRQSSWGQHSLDLGQSYEREHSAVSGPNSNTCHNRNYSKPGIAICVAADRTQPQRFLWNGDCMPLLLLD